MLADSNTTTSRVGWKLWACVVLLAVAVLVLPAIYVSSGSGVLAGGKTDPSIEFLPKPSPFEQRILEVLDGPTEMKFIETPLQDAINDLKNRHRIEIQLDLRALENAAIGADTPVTRTVSDVKLKSGLDLLLSDMDLTYLIKNEVLLITSKDKAETELLTLTYPVGDLAEEKGDTLIDVITSTVAPTTWDEVGRPGSIRYVPRVKGLVVSQTRDRQQEVLELLRSLRGAQVTRQ